MLFQTAFVGIVEDILWIKFSFEFGEEFKISMSF